MFIRTTRSFLLVSLFLFSFEAVGAGPPDRRDSHVIPSISVANSEQRTEEMSWAYWCYSLRNGAPRGCTILHHTLFGVAESVSMGIVSRDCEIEANGTIKPGTCADGGHQHIGGNSTEPVIRNQGDPNAMLMLTGDTNPDRFIVAGPTVANNWVIVKYEVPDNAGFFYWQAHVQPPPCYFLPQYCGFTGPGAQDDGTFIWDGTVEVSYDGLEQLPDMNNLYRKVRSADTLHVDDVAFAGDATAIEAMRLIATEFNINTGKLLRPNDMSLPLGGLFDVTGGWGTPHQSHRFGRDIDMNRASVVLLPGGGETTSTAPCEQDREFVEAVNKILLGVRNVTITPPGGTPQVFSTAVLCESGGRKHIDVTNIIGTPQTP